VTRRAARTVLFATVAGVGLGACTLLFPYEDLGAPPNDCFEACPCTVVEDCPAACGVPSCVDGTCALEPYAPGTDPEVECFDGVCDGAGQCAEGRLLAAFAYEGSGAKTIADLAVLGDGSVVVVGSFSGSLELGPLQSAGGSDGFVARIGADGAVLWARVLEGLGDDRLTAVAPSANGVVVCGAMGGDASFAGADLPGAGGADIFLAGLDAAGERRWQQVFGGTADESCDAVAVSADGGVHFVASFAGHLTIGDQSFDAGGDTDMVVGRLDDEKSGAYVLATAFGGAGAARPRAVAVAAGGGIVVAGAFNTEIVLGDDTLVTGGTSDIFLAALDAGEDVIWASTFGTPSEGDEPWAIAAAGGDVVVCGQLWNDVEALDLTPLNDSDLLGFVARFEPGGALAWGAGYAQEAFTDQIARDCALDRRGNVLVAGSFEGEVDFGFGPIPAAGMGPEQPADAFVAKHADDGTPLWTRTWGDADVDEALAVGSAPNGEVVAAGVFRGDVQLDPEHALGTASPDGALFLVRLSP
jgi:hypothetical protein